MTSRSKGGGAKDFFDYAKALVTKFVTKKGSKIVIKLRDVIYERSFVQSQSYTISYYVFLNCVSINFI